MTKEIKHIKEVIKMHINKFFKNYNGKHSNIEYRLIMDVICRHYGHENVCNLLLYKRNKVAEDLV